MSETPEKPPSSNNVTTIYLTPVWQDRIQAAKEKAGTPSVSELVRFLVAEYLGLKDTDL